MTKGKKIAIISVASVLLAIVIAIIVLAVVQSTFYKPDVTKADEIRIYINNKEIGIGVCTNPDNYATTDDEGNKIYTDIMEMNKKISSESVLTCMLGGAYAFEEEVDEMETTISSIKSDNEIVIEFSFDSEQVLMFNGEEKPDNDGNAIKYNKMYVVVNNTTELSTSYAYLYNTKDDDSNFRITYWSKQAEMFEYIKSIEA